MVNLQIIVGHLGRDPELRFMQNGNPVCNFSVAASEKWTTKEGEKKEHTEWFAVQVFGKTAEHCGKYLEKGRLVYVEGKTRTREYQDKEGNTRKVVEVIASNVRFLGGGSRREEGRQQGSFDAPSGEIDEIPF